MSRSEPQAALRFSLGGTAFQVACGLTVVAAAAFLVYQFGFRFETVPEQARRADFLWDFFRSGNGATGAIFLALSGLFFCWHLRLAAWRFATSGKTALLTKRGLPMHATYAKAEIPFEMILSADVRSHGYLVHSLYIRVANRRRIRLQSTAIEGGKEALLAFAEELNARRTFSGGSEDGSA